VQREALNISVQAARTRTYKLRKPESEQRCRQDIKNKKIKKTNMREVENPECKSSLDALSKL
jgi:hypothetical protein